MCIRVTCGNYDFAIKGPHSLRDSPRHMATVEFAVVPECLETYKAFKLRRKHRYVVFACSDEKSEIYVDNKGQRNASLADLKTALSTDTNPRYIVYDHEYENDEGHPKDKLFFITYIPFQAHAKGKMLYTHQKKTLKDKLGGGLFDMNVTSFAEIKTELAGGKGDDGEDSDEESDFDF